MRHAIFRFLSVAALCHASVGAAATLTIIGDSLTPFPDSVVYDDPDQLCLCTTRTGGRSGLGTIFKNNIDGTQTVLVNFNGANGASPHGALVSDRAGTLYGTTQAGGKYGFGTVFSYSTAGKLNTLFSFDGFDGNSPHGGVLVDAVGTLFGSTAFGGTHNRGTLFRLANDGSFTTLLSFNGTNGGRPMNRLMFDAQGIIYGRTRDGGSVTDIVRRGAALTSASGTTFKLTDVGFSTGAVGPVPEPANWAMLIAGFGLIGAVQRTRRIASA